MIFWSVGSEHVHLFPSSLPLSLKSFTFSRILSDRLGKHSLIMASASAFGDVVEDDSTKNSKGFKASSSGFVRRHALPSLGPATSAAKAAVAQRKKATMAQRKKDRYDRAMSRLKPVRVHSAQREKPEPEDTIRHYID
jgi:hypothetical protein